jgi:peptide-methionine (R)-S-oxide reductase
MSQMNANRRAVLLGTLGLGALIAAPGCVAAAEGGARFANSKWRKLSDAEWKKRLSPLAYSILRHEATEYAGTSPLDHEHRKGTFVCLGCELPLFKSDWKFDSGTGWPSFYTAFNANLIKKTDRQLLEVRTAYACAQCLGHQGHVFNDGPKPTGLRYCNNGASLKFIPG